MSLICAIKDKDRFVLASDMQSSTGTGKEHSATKIWRAYDNPDIIVGSVGSMRVSQIIQFSYLIDKNLLGADIDTGFIVSSVVPVLATTLKANGVVIDATDEISFLNMPNSFVIAYKDKCWVIGNDFSVSEIDDYTALGSGSDIARGALFASEGADPFTRAVVSIAAASESDLYVDNRINLLSTKTYQEDEKLIKKALGYEEGPKKKSKRTKKQTEK